MSSPDMHPITNYRSWRICTLVLFNFNLQSAMLTVFFKSNLANNRFSGDVPEIDVIFPEIIIWCEIAIFLIPYDGEFIMCG